jgi:hypothetical protein
MLPSPGGMAVFYFSTLLRRKTSRSTVYTHLYEQSETPRGTVVVNRLVNC